VVLESVGKKVWFAAMMVSLERRRYKGKTTRKGKEIARAGTCSLCWPAAVDFRSYPTTAQEATRFGSCEEFCSAAIVTAPDRGAIRFRQTSRQGDLFRGRVMRVRVREAERAAVGGGPGRVPAWRVHGVVGRTDTGILVPIKNQPLTRGGRRTGRSPRSKRMGGKEAKLERVGLMNVRPGRPGGAPESEQHGQNIGSAGEGKQQPAERQASFSRNMRRTDQTTGKRELASQARDKKSYHLHRWELKAVFVSAVGTLPA